MRDAYRRRHNARAVGANGVVGDTQFEVPSIAALTTIPVAFRAPRHERLRERLGSDDGDVVRGQV